MTISRKIAFSNAVPVILTVILGATALYQIGRIKRAFESVSTDSLPGVTSISQIESYFEALRGDAWEQVAATDAAKLALIRAQMERRKEGIQTELRNYESTIQRAEDRELFGKMKPEILNYFDVLDKLQSSLALSAEEASKVYWSQGDPAFAKAIGSIRKVVQWNVHAATQDASMVQSSSQMATVMSWIILIASVVIGATLSAYVIWGVNRDLRAAVVDLKSGAEQVATAASQLSVSSENLSQGTNEQASSIEETSATSEEIAAMAAKNLESARSASEIVELSQARFSETTAALDSMAVAMTDLSNSSNRISKIIKVIDEIAFQTNILALNAAVEAARAGEAGLGFAVVAEQVRNLAQRCAQAAKDTESLIRDSIANTEGGKQKSDCVSKLVREVAAESAQIRTLMEEVRRGSEEQSRGMQQIAGALHQLGTVTQTSASTAEESAAAAEELSSQSHMVREVAQHLEQLAGTTSGGRRTLRVRRTSPA